MSGYAAFYSIVRFCPDVARGEGTNVGVVVVCPDLNAVKARFSANNERVRKQFGKVSFDDGRLTAAKRALAHRLSGLMAKDADLRAFISQESGSLAFDDLRPMVIHDWDTDVEALFDELVGEISSQRRSKESAPNLDQYFLPLFSAHVPIERNVRVKVPGLGRELHVPYAYRNGAVNYIKPQGFGDDADATLKRAQSLGSQGYLIQKHPQGDTPEQLVVIGSFKESALLLPVRRIFDDFKVKLVPSDQVADFVRQIQQEAH